MVTRPVVAFVASVALALLPHGSAAQAQPQQAAGRLPTRGVLVVGQSLAGIRLGQTQVRVKQLWGGGYRPCTTYPCVDPTWLYFYHSGEPLGAAVRFRKGKVVAVFTLGAVPGWKSRQGIAIADPSSKIYDSYGNPRYTKCIGFEALSVTQNGVVTSFYLTSGVVYGFALTTPGMSVCQ
jgi:hypothetical protein